jgi:hypothetical protein
MTGYLDILVFFISFLMLCFISNQHIYLAHLEFLTTAHLYTHISAYSPILSVILINYLSRPRKYQFFVTHILVCHPLFPMNHLVRALYRRI